MRKSTIEFWVDDNFILDPTINPVSKNNIIEFQSGQIKIEDVLNMPDEQLKIIFCELIKKFATPKSSGGGRKFSLDL